MKYIKRIIAILRDAVRAARWAKPDKWSQFCIFFDYLHCKLKFHVACDEYIRYGFFNHKDRYRKNFLLKYHQIKKFRYINIPGFTKSKYRFYQMIPDSFAREMLLAPECGEERFLALAKRSKKVVVKPDGGSCGKDVTVFTYTDDAQAREYYANLPEKTICEEFIVQHEKMNQMNPDSVNTIRIVSLFADDQVNIISATLRTGGQKGVVVDNLRKNGVGAQIDMTTGIITTCGFDYNGGRFVYHPVSGTQILGFQIPHWDQVIALVKKSHTRLSQCQILGWDIAVTQTGVDIVEANNRPGTPITQMVDLIPKGEKILQEIRKAEKKKKRK